MTMHEWIIHGLKNDAGDDDDEAATPTTMTRKAMAMAMVMTMTMMIMTNRLLEIFIRFSCIYYSWRREKFLTK